jgi:hypothetical protein
VRLKELPLNDRSRTDNSPYLRNEKENPEGEDKEFMATAKTLRSKGDKKRHEIQADEESEEEETIPKPNQWVIKRVYTNLRDTILGSEKEVTKSKSDKESNKKIMKMKAKIKPQYR